MVGHRDCFAGLGVERQTVSESDVIRVRSVSVQRISEHIGLPSSRPLSTEPSHGQWRNLSTSFMLSTHLGMSRELCEQARIFHGAADVDRLEVLVERCR